MKKQIAPIVITCGDPAGVGPEIALSAWEALRDEIPICFIIDPKFLPEKINKKVIYKICLKIKNEKNN